MKYNHTYAFPVLPSQVLPTNNRFLTFLFKCSTCKRLMLNPHWRGFLYGKPSFIQECTSTSSHTGSDVTTLLYPAFLSLLRCTTEKVTN